MGHVVGHMAKATLRDAGTHALGCSRLQLYQEEPELSKKKNKKLSLPSAYSVGLWDCVMGC